MPPKKMPGTSSNPVFHETKPSFEYAINANSPVGGISAIKEVPCARCCSNAKSSPRSGTRRTPPPTPNIPEATPQTHAAAKIPALRPAASATSFLLAGAGHVRIALRLSPEQEACQHEETSKCTL